MDSPLLLFQHIPKTAGMTLKTVIMDNFRRSEVFLAYRGEGMDGRPPSFPALSEPRKKVIKCIYGHFPLSQSVFFPSPGCFFAFLRDPFRRKISEYESLKRFKIHSLYPIISQMSFEQFLTYEITPYTDNMQTKWLSGEKAWRVGPCTREIFNKARRNIDDFYSYIGTQDNIEAGIKTICDYFGWPVPESLDSKNVRSNKVRLEDLPTATRRKVVQTHVYDFELYNYAREKFRDGLTELKVRSLEDIKEEAALA